jgi:hypothetical protein
VGHVAHEVTCRFLMGKPEGKRAIGEPSRRWKKNIRADLKNLGGKYLDLIEKVRLFRKRKTFLC